MHRRNCIIKAVHRASDRCKTALYVRFHWTARRRRRRGGGGGKRSKLAESGRRMQDRIRAGSLSVRLWARYRQTGFATSQHTQFGEHSAHSHVEFVPWFSRRFSDARQSIGYNLRNADRSKWNQLSPHAYFLTSLSLSSQLFFVIIYSRVKNENFILTSLIRDYFVIHFKLFKD